MITQHNTLSQQQLYKQMAKQHRRGLIA